MPIGFIKFSDTLIRASCITNIFMTSTVEGHKGMTKITVSLADYDFYTEKIYASIESGGYSDITNAELRLAEISRDIDAATIAIAALYK